MTPEVREFVKQAGLCRSTVEQMAAMLPDDDLELDNWISQAIHENDSLAFHLLVYAALIRERPVDARHLASGAKLAGGAWYLAAMAFRVQGEMPEYVLEGLRNTAIAGVVHAMALLTILVWCDERRHGVYPDPLLAQARELARRGKPGAEFHAYLIDIAIRTEDVLLRGLIRGHYPKASDAVWEDLVISGEKIAKQYIQQARMPILAVLEDTPIYGPERGPVRRAAPRLGRNEPCHCGSGKKYKHCHYEEDRQRLQQSSEIAGMTRSELRSETGGRLTFERLDKLPASDIARLDPSVIPRHLLTDYFMRLSYVDLDQAAAYLEKLRYDDNLEDAWSFIMFTAVRTGRKDIGERLFGLRQPFGLKEEDLRLSHRLLLARDEPAKWLRLVENAALNALKNENSEDFTELAFSVIHSDARALGLILYRGVLPFIPPDEAKNSYGDIILPVRERLDLPAADPLKDFLDTRAMDTESALQEAEDKFEAKRREVRALRELLDQVQKELARREREPAADSAAPVQSGGENDPAARQLREKVKQLESDLKERHNERNALQRQLEKMQSRVESLVERMQSGGSGTIRDAEAEREDELLLPQDAEENHPLRLIEFPRNFLERLNEFPHHVARGALAILGRLAGGDPGAFSGAKRLKSVSAVVRQRVGIDFRLLFRLLPDRIQVIELIPRQDLERKIKTLR